MGLGVLGFEVSGLREVWVSGFRGLVQEAREQMCPQTLPKLEKVRTSTSRQTLKHRASKTARRHATRHGESHSGADERQSV